MRLSDVNVGDDAGEDDSGDDTPTAHVDDGDTDEADETPEGDGVAPDTTPPAG